MVFSDASLVSPQASTIIQLAEVIDRVDPTNSGQFIARIAALGNELISINYTTPYASNEGGAFIAVPEVGTQVLVCQPTGSTSWYYLGATFAPQPKESTGALTIDNVELTPFEIAAPELTAALGVPMRLQWTGTQGEGIRIIDETNDSMMNKKVEINSIAGKKVSLNDNPTADALILDSGNGATIRLTDNPQMPSISPARAVLVNSEGPQRYINGKSQTSIAVVDGRELNLINDSTGLMGSPVAPAGNVNIQSKWQDVNVFTKGIDSKIFIKCLGTEGVDQVIEISTAGTGGGIDIKTQGKVNIIGSEGISIDSLGPINMKGSNINLEATAGGVNINSPGTINLKGTTVHLMPPYSLPPITSPVRINVDDYQGLGISTY